MSKQHDIEWMNKHLPTIIIPLADGKLTQVQEIKPIEGIPYQFLINDEPTRKLAYAFAVPVQHASELNKIMHNTPFNDIRIKAITDTIRHYQYRVASKTLTWAKKNQKTVKVYIGTGQAFSGIIEEFTEYEVYLKIGEIPLMIYRHALLAIYDSENSKHPTYRNERLVSDKWKPRTKNKREVKKE